MSRAIVVVACACAALVYGCFPRVNVECVEDSNCDLGPGGLCYVNPATDHRWCTYLDTECSAGRRWSDVSVGDGVLGQCFGCDGNESCSTATPYCLAGACVGCDTSAACSIETPVCDERTHSCRRCSLDHECSSGVCDLGAGNCVAEAAILFASPGGTTLDACSRTSPCSLALAFSKVDPAHLYVELTPGVYTVGATLDGKTATIVADSATVRVVDADGEVQVRNQGSLTIRHLKILAGADVAEGLLCDGNSSLEVVDLEAMGRGITTNECRSVKVNVSTFIDAGISFGAFETPDAGIIIDRTKFLGLGPSIIGGSFFAVITNSLIVSNQSALQLLSVVNGSPTVETRIEHNTIVGGVVNCNNPATPGRARRFRDNIFVDQSSALPKANACTYDYNLTMPRDFALGGIGNTTGDPRFVDRAGGDYHLQLGSPAIDQADPTSIEDHDLDGARRPQGGRADIGAFERRP